MALPYIMHAPTIRFSLVQRKEGDLRNGRYLLKDNTRALLIMDTADNR
jgi:hypothetical protein